MPGFSPWKLSKKSNFENKMSPMLPQAQDTPDSSSLKNIQPIWFKRQLQLTYKYKYIYIHTLLEKPAYNQQYLVHAQSHEDPL